MQKCDAKRRHISRVRCGARAILLLPFSFARPYTVIIISPALVSNLIEALPHRVCSSSPGVHLCAISDCIWFRLPRMSTCPHISLFSAERRYHGRQALSSILVLSPSQSPLIFDPPPTLSLYFKKSLYTRPRHSPSMLRGLCRQSGETILAALIMHHPRFTFIAIPARQNLSTS